MLDHFLDMLFPQETCCICRKPGKYCSQQPWCQECLDRMIELQCSGPTCEKCGKYLQPRDRDCVLTVARIRLSSRWPAQWDPMKSNTASLPKS